MLEIFIEYKALEYANDDYFVVIKKKCHCKIVIAKL